MELTEKLYEKCRLRDWQMRGTMAGMNRIFQGICLSIVVSLLVGTVCGAKSEMQGQYKPPVINKRLFGEDLSMVDNERDEYATNLAAYAVKVIKEAQGDQASLDTARRVLALALHLSHRNKKCLVVNVQLKRGIMPEDVAIDYAPDVFARLLLTRGQLLEKRERAGDAMVARYFIELAAGIDPRNEDAVYEAEIRRIDHGEMDWTRLTDATAGK